MTHRSHEHLHCLSPEQLAQRLVLSQELLLRFPESAGVRCSRATVLADACRYREALKELTRAERLLGAQHSYLHELRGEVYLARGDGARAEKAFTLALAGSSDPSPSLGLARAQMLREHTTAALNLLRRAWRRWGKGEERSLVAQELVWFWARQLQPGVAKRWLRHLPGKEMPTFPTGPFENRVARMKFREARRLAVGHPLMLAHVDHEARRYRAACRRWLSLESQLGAAAFILGGSAAARAGDLLLAESLQRRAIGFNDTELLSEAWLNLALVLRAQGRFGEAQAACENAQEEGAEVLLDLQEAQRLRPDRPGPRPAGRIASIPPASGAPSHGSEARRPHSQEVLLPD